MKNISLLIKPVSARCQYRCRYCFYDKLASTRSEKDLGIMQNETVFSLISSVFAHKPRYVSFVFQGGEPLLAGIGFYETFIDTVDQFNTCNAHVQYSLQTNGALIDEKFCHFFKKHRFLIGLSLDGTKEMNDFNRIDAFGKSTFSATMAAARMLKKEGVMVNVLNVLTDQNARYGEKIYRFYRANGLDYMQFIPCIDEVGSKRNSLSPGRLATFLKTVFDLWYIDLINGRPSYIRQFENYVNLLCGLPAEDCSMNGYCGLYYVVEADGSLYPCDFYCVDEYRVGDLKTDDPFAITEKHRSFIDQSLVLPDKCKSCKYFILCRGGCRRDRQSPEQINKYCDGYYDFFDYTYNRLLYIAEQIKHKHS